MFAPGELITHGDISHPLEDLIAVVYVTDAAGATSWKGVYTDQMGGGVLVCKKEKADGQMYRINLQATVATLRSFYRQTKAASDGTSPWRRIAPFSFGLSLAERQEWECLAKQPIE